MGSLMHSPDSTNNTNGHAQGHFEGGAAWTPICMPENGQRHDLIQTMTREAYPHPLSVARLSQARGED